MSNFGCAVNGNLAAMVANPSDLVHGREGSGVGRRRHRDQGDPNPIATPSRPATGGLKDISTKKGN